MAEAPWGTKASPTTEQGRNCGGITSTRPIMNPELDASARPDVLPVPAVRLSGLVKCVTFHDEENGFGVLKVKANGHCGLVTVAGSLARSAPGSILVTLILYMLLAPP